MERIKEIYDLQKHVVIVCGEGIVDEHGKELGAEHDSNDPAGNIDSERGGGDAAGDTHPAPRRHLFHE